MGVMVVKKGGRMRGGPPPHNSGKPVKYNTRGWQLHGQFQPGGKCTPTEHHPPPSSKVEHAMTQWPNLH